jgi:hypothetical protein
MSLENSTTMRLSILVRCESRRNSVRFGNDFLQQKKEVLESKYNRCHAPSYRPSGVGGVGMLRSVIETNREILTAVEVNETTDASHVTSYRNSECMGNCKEVGGVHSSVDVSVMEYGAKGPYLVNVNRDNEGYEMAGNRYKVSMNS